MINKKLLKDAENGVAVAQLKVGLHYEQNEDYEKAFKWFNKAAEQGDAPAQNHLGLMYLDGQGVDINFEEAFVWFAIAAEQGNSEAQCNLGRMYIDVVHGSLEDAAYWLNQAYKQGNAEAEELLNEYNFWGMC